MTSNDEPRADSLMERDPPIAHLHETLERAWSSVHAAGSQTVAVVDGDRIVAVISAALLERRCRDVEDWSVVCLRDCFRPPVPFVYAEDPLAAARQAITRAAAEGMETGAVAVVDRDQRLLGIIDVAQLGDDPPGGPPRVPEDPTDRSHLESPRLTVYAPWAALTD